MTDSWHLRIEPPMNAGPGRELSGTHTIERVRQASVAAEGEGLIVGSFVSPLMCDTHTHGRLGHAVTDSLDTLRELVAVNRAGGLGRSQLSTVTLSIPDIHATLAAARELMSSEESVIGFHLEGPFLSPEKRGAHSHELLLRGSLETVQELVSDYLDVVSAITLDPLAVESGVIEWLVDQGVVVAVGHTTATFDEALAAFTAGASVLTHAFNAMRPISSREPGPVMAALEAGVWIEVIADGHHVHPSLVKFLGDSAPERLLLVTDSMPAAGLGDGSYELGSLSVSVVDGVARTTEGSLAGSTLSLDAAVAHSVRAGVSPEVALAAATTNPLKAYGQSVPTISEGQPANLLVWSEDLRITHMIRDGQLTAWA